MVFLFDQVGIPAGNEFQRVAGARRPGTAQPDLAEPTASEEADEMVAVEFLTRCKDVISRRHTAMGLPDAGAAGKAVVMM